MSCTTFKPAGATFSKTGDGVQALGLNQIPAVNAVGKPRRRINLDLSTAPANGYLVVQFPGSVIWVNKAVGTAPEIEVAFDEEERDQAVVLQPNYFLRGVPYRKLKIYWNAQPGASMVLQLFADKPDDTVGIL